MKIPFIFIYALLTVFVFMRMFYTCVLKRCMQCDILRSCEIYACVQNTYSDEYMFSAKEEEAVVLRVF
jgi:hypothetical protein